MESQGWGPNPIELVSLQEKGPPEFFLYVSAGERPCKHTSGKWLSTNQEKNIPPETKLANTLLMDVLAYRTGRKCLLFRLLIWWHSVMAA